MAMPGTKTKMETKEQLEIESVSLLSRQDIESLSLQSETKHVKIFWNELVLIPCSLGVRWIAQNALEQHGINSAVVYRVKEVMASVRKQANEKLFIHFYSNHLRNTGLLTTPLVYDW